MPPRFSRRARPHGNAGRGTPQAAAAGTSGTQIERTGIGSLRRPQIITTFGPGAVVDMPEYTVLVGSASYWYPFGADPGFVLHEPNLERLLRVQEFREPPFSEDESRARGADIPAMRFPAMHFCPECGKLAPYWEFRPDDRFCCSGHERTRILPSRFLIMCAHGHLDDFPYAWWVHSDTKNGCQARDSLRISFSADIDGPHGITITCTACGAHRTMEDAAGPGAFNTFRCPGRRPWVWRSGQEFCTEHVYGAVRTASNVYFPKTAGALTIPPWSLPMQEALGPIWAAHAGVLEQREPDEAALAQILNSVRRRLPPAADVSPDDVVEAVRVRREAAHTSFYDEQTMRREEYQVLSGPEYVVEEDLHFRTKHVQVPVSMSPYISDLVLVPRLREVLALEGFHRVRPGPDTAMQPAVPDERWLPAVEMRGEGIFLRLPEAAVRHWEEDAGSRYEALRERALASREVRAPNFSPRYVLLHTLSHLLIRQLAAESGYSAAAIKERIYSSEDGSMPMAGLLLYTASSDADGSLGGLVRRGRPASFEETLFGALENALWCASDPVCSESHAQGTDSLNYAACHACTLLPETSCEMRNCLLDRAAVVGTRAEPDTGYFSELAALL